MDGPGWRKSPPSRTDGKCIEFKQCFRSAIIAKVGGQGGTWKVVAMMTWGNTFLVCDCLVKKSTPKPLVVHAAGTPGFNTEYVKWKTDMEKDVPPGGSVPPAHTPPS